MPFSLTVESGLLRVVLFGNLTMAELLRLADTVVESERTRGMTPNQLTDVSQVSGRDLGYFEVLTLADRRRVRTLANPIKSAIVAPKPVDVGFARMFQTLNDHPQIETAIFPTLGEAEAWLATPDT
jgi:hypothetical protein